MLSDAQLRELAGEAAYERGRDYAAKGLIDLDRHDADSLHGVAHGNATYDLSLRREGTTWRWNCTCWAAGDGAFCKHLVAAVLVARDGLVAAPQRDCVQSDPKAAAPRDDLLDFLRAQPAERLAGWLNTFADNDTEIDRRLRLYRAADDPAALKLALGRTLCNAGVLDHRGSIRYAQRLDAAVESLRDCLARDAQTCRALCEYALGRLLKVYERSDDSAGAIGMRVGELADLHARASRMRPPGKALVKPLLALQRSDDWDLFPLHNYWDALGAEGQAAYAKAIQIELDRLFAVPAAQRSAQHAEFFSILHRAEVYARCTEDFDLLQRVLRWDLTHPHDHLRVIEALRQFGREREALAFGEAAVKRFPHDANLHTILAQCMRAAGLRDEAVEQSWQALRAFTSEATWDELKRSSGDDWPAWRARALAHLATHSADAAQRVVLLLHDGDIAAAIELARTQPVSVAVLQAVAERSEATFPDIAGELHLQLVAQESRNLMQARYPSLVTHLRHASRLLPESTWRPVLAQVRAEHARKPRLMELLTEAGL